VHGHPLSSHSIRAMPVGRFGGKGMGRLTALRISRPLQSGMYADGNGLYLQVTGVGAKSWVYRFSIRGKAREMGLGSLSAVSLANARAEATAYRALRLKGIDPIEARRAERAQAALNDAKTITFKESAERYIKAHRAGWKGPRHANIWESTLAAYAYPVIGKISVQAIDTALVLRVLEPIWTLKPETANRVRGRMEVILDWATARGYRSGENPARWRGHLKFQLADRFKVRRVEHHPALPYAQLSDFITELRKQEGIGALALEFTILTAARTGEVLGATRDEIDLAQKVWTVPAKRMKTGKEHRVSLAGRALAILQGVTALQMAGNAFIFPGAKRGRPLSNTAMHRALKRMGNYHAYTVHGFRSTFRDWAAERTNYPGEVVEMALAHAVGNKVEAAYRRGDLFEKRKRLMADWAKYCETPTAKARGTVVPIRAVTSESRSAGNVA
jgi:integrase